MSQILRFSSRTLRSLAAFVAGVSLWSAPACSTAAPDYGEIAFAVANAMQSNHYSRHDFDEAYSQRMLDLYINLLDYDHRFFLQSDVDQFRLQYGTELDDAILVNSDVSAAQKIYDVFSQRVKARIAKAQEMLKTEKFTFDGSDEASISRKKLPWPKTEAEADDLWKRILKNQVLAERLNRQNKAERQAEKAAKAKADGKEPPKAAPAPEETPEEKTAKFWTRFEKSLEENDQEEVVNFFLSSLAAAYDPHSEYMSPSEIENFQVGMRNSLVGIGALLGKKEDAVEIQGIVVGGPADKSGLLKEGDKIIAVGQGPSGELEDIRALKLQKIVDQIRGDEGSTVRLRIIPASDPGIEKEISIVRAKVDLKDKVANANLIETSKADGQPLKLGWITLPAFYADMDTHESGCTKDVRALLERLMKENINGLVLDLRGNGGGSLEEAISMTGLFVKRGPVVQILDWRRDQTFRSCHNANPIYDGPLVVLTDKTSASASEILAAALQDYGRAVIVGDKSTFGKGTVQQIADLRKVMPLFSDTSRAGALKVTIQKFYRIAGGSTQFQGVLSDVILPQRVNALEIGEDQLDYPLPHDDIKPLPYSLYERAPMPVDQLKDLSATRIASEPEFRYLVEDTNRLRDQLARNTLSLNEKARMDEIKTTKERRKIRNDERKKRITELGDAQKNQYKVFRLTLDSVNEPALKLESDFTDEQTTGMRLAKDEDEDEDETIKFPYDLEPVKLETIKILSDLITVSDSSRTAQAVPAR